MSGQERPGKHIHAVDGQSIVLRPAESAARQLAQLPLHYLVNQPSLICQPALNILAIHEK